MMAASTAQGRYSVKRQDMSHFRLLTAPEEYSVGDADLLGDAQQREYWLKVFEDHFRKAAECARAAYGRASERRVAAAEAQFAEALAALRADPASAGERLGVVELCRLREKALRDNGLDDPFRHIKRRENVAAVEIYEDVLRSVSALPSDQRWERLIRGVLAGNVFDLGSEATIGYADETADFAAAIERVKPRPWRVDDFDALVADLPVGGEPARWAKAVVFVDNAGIDFVLGVVPLVRQLAGCGVQIVLAANELPSLNDVTADETVELLEALAAIDDDLASYVNAGLFEVVSTGNDIPLLDLSEVSDELNAAAADADLVVLEGMGRTVESNLNTAFAVDSVQLCQLKDPAVAARVSGEVFDCVCMYRPVEDQSQD